MYNISYGFVHCMLSDCATHSFFPKAGNIYSLNLPIQFHFCFTIIYTSLSSVSCHTVKTGNIGSCQMRTFTQFLGLIFILLLFLNAFTLSWPVSSLL